MHCRKAVARLSSISKHCTRRTMSSTSLAKPADSLTSAKVISKSQLDDPKWVHLEAIKWRNPGGQEVSWAYSVKSAIPTELLPFHDPER